MAKKFYTLNEVLNMTQSDLKNMSKSELSKAVSSMRSVARKRVERMEKQEIYSPAYSGLQRSGGIPSVKGMSEQQLRNEYKRYKDFITAKTSTVTTAKQYEKTTIENVKKWVKAPSEQEQQIFNKWIETNKGEIFKYLDHFRETGATTSNNYKEHFNIIANYIYSGGDVGKDKEDIYTDIRKRLDKFYQTGAKEIYTSDIFNVVEGE